MKVIEDLGIDNLKIIQDDTLYRFTSDSVLLSRFATVKPKDKVADFCSGSGIVGIHTYALNKEKIESVTLFEMQKLLFDMSMQSVELNALTEKFSGENVRLQDIPKKYNEKFSLILCNPTYEKDKGGIDIERREIAVCKKEITLTLKEITATASKCLKYGGRFALCHKAERLTDVLCEMRKANIEPKRLSLVYGGEKLYLVLVEGVKGGKSGLKIEKTVIN